MMPTKTILIIEDDETILDVLETVLSANNFNVHGISRTDNIVDTVKKYSPDLILTDYLLSGLNGGKICQVIKSTKETCLIPVVLISGFQELAISLGNFGFDGFIPKPFEIGHLVSTIKNLLAKAA